MCTLFSHLYKLTNWHPSIPFDPCNVDMPYSPAACSTSELGVVMADWASLSVQAIWAKGYTELLELMEMDSASREMHTHVDCYGYGDDLEEVPLLPSLCVCLIVNM